MERSDERLSTRDIASPSPAEPERTAPEHAEPVDRGPSPEAIAAAATPDAPGTGAATPAPAAAAAAPDATGPSRDSTTNGNAPLLSDADGFQARWEEIQVRFVDEPRGAVEDADALVATVMKRLAEGFAQERERLEAQWGRGEDISTEDLRVALQRYRSFFQRLLST
jgi:hypothetical protein